MNIFITGGTGFVGSNLATRFSAQGHRVTILTRSIREGGSSPEGVSFLQGDPVEKGSWQKSVPEHEIIINLAGASIFSFWTKRRKRLIRDSRVQTTLNLVEALSERKGKETLLLSTSAVGYYGSHGDEALDESSDPGNDIYRERQIRKNDLSGIFSFTFCVGKVQISKNSKNNKGNCQIQTFCLKLLLDFCI